MPRSKPPNLLKKLKKGLKSVGKAVKKALPVVAGAVLPGAAASLGPVGQALGSSLGIPTLPTGSTSLSDTLGSVVGALGSKVKCSGAACNAKPGVVAPMLTSSTVIRPAVAPAGPPIIGLILGGLALWGAIASFRKG